MPIIKEKSGMTMDNSKISTLSRMCRKVLSCKSIGLIVKLSSN